MAPRLVSVTIRYAKPGTRPPVYLAGSFSNPAWQAAEMEYTSEDGNEYEFHQEVQVEAAKEYQYKFRIGEGDWWVLNEDSPSGTDNAGNRNNLLNIPISEDVVEQPSHTMAENVPSSAQAEADNVDAKSVEEKMGTRESSDVLFDDEIVKESNETAPAQARPDVQPPLVEKSPQPISEKKQVETSELKKDHLGLLDGSGSEHPEKEPTALPEERQQASSKQTNEPQIEPTDLDSLAEKQDSLSNDEAQETDMSSESVLTGGSTNHDEAITGALKEKHEGLAPALTIKEIDAQNNRDREAALSEKDNGSEPGYIMVEDRTLTPEIANTAAEVADTAAVLDPRESTPPISDDEAGQMGYRRMSETPIPDIADIAAEVADSAAALDPRAHTPPISDEEAGRIGYRRMSQTPIPQVAETAAEVADVAAVLDQEHSLEAARAAFEASLTPEEREYVMSGRSTPEDEKVPLFPHEMPVLLDDAEPTKPAKEQTPEFLAPPSPYITQEFDPRDLEPFPTDREGILEHLREMQERLPEDEVNVDIAPAPSAVIYRRSSHSGSPNRSAEEKLEDQSEELTKLSALSDIKAEPIVEHEGQTSPAIIIKHVESETDTANDSDGDEKRQVTSFGKTNDPLVLQGLTPVAPVAPVVPSTPFATSDQQLGDENVEEASESKKDVSNPKIKFIPATPAGSIMQTTDPFESVVDGKASDMGESTAIEDKSGLIRARKQNASPAPDRPLTPSSMRSAGKDAHERNFLKAFWRVVFVDWIGGLIFRLCGGDRRKTALLAVGIAAFAVTSALYYLP